MGTVVSLRALFMLRMETSHADPVALYVDATGKAESLDTPLFRCGTANVVIENHIFTRNVEIRPAGVVTHKPAMVAYSRAAEHIRPDRWWYIPCYLDARFRQATLASGVGWPADGSLRDSCVLDHIRHVVSWAT
jgi:hypothetical protein